MINNDIVPGFDDEKDESLKITLQAVPDVDGCLVLVLNGYIDTYNSGYFQKRVQRVVDAVYTRLIFNCGALNYVSSTGIGSFTAFLKTVKPQGGDLVLLDLQSKIFEVFQLLGFSQFFNTRDTLHDSIGFFRDNGAVAHDPLSFPRVFSCPVCPRKLKAVKPGRFRCSECKSILNVDSDGNISLG